MKLLIIAGPYEADRLRRAAVAAGFETVAVEPGESLSGWIAASRPDFIIMAPRMVNPDPVAALAKVRAVAAGRVPTFLVGEKDDEVKMRGVADGFFVRPVAPEDLLVEARRRVELARKPDSGPRDHDFLAAQSRSFAVSRGTPTSMPAVTPSLKPLVAERSSVGPRPPAPVLAPPTQAAPPPAPVAPPQGDEMVKRISQSIDATLDAEIWEALRTVQALRRSDTMARGRTGEGKAIPAPPATPAEPRPSSTPQPTRPPTGSGLVVPEAVTGLERPPTGSGLVVPEAVTGLERPRTDPQVTGFQAVAAGGRVTAVFGDDPGEDMRVATLIGPALSSGSEEPGEDPLPLSAEMAREALAELSNESSHKTVEAPRDLFASVLAREEPTGVSAQDTEAEARLLYPSTGLVEPVPPQADEARIAPAESGSLAENDLAALLGRAFVQQITGHLELRRQGARKVIFFEDGQPVQATSNVYEDRMVNMLLREGRLSAEQHARGVETATTTGRRMGAVLVDLGYIKQNELFPLVRRHYEQIIYGMFAWEAGEWFFGPEAAAPSEKIRLSRNPVALILEGISRKYTVERLRHLLGGDDRLFRSVGAPGPDGLSQTGLTDDERRIAGLFDGVRTLREVKAQAGGPAELVYALAWAMLVVDMLERVESTTAERSPLRWLGEDRERRIDRERVMQRHSLVVEGDYFQILGVGRDASAHEIRRAHESLRNEFSPGAFHADLAGDLAAELQAIRAVLDESLRVLGDDDLRARYRAHLPSPQ